MLSARRLFCSARGGLMAHTSTRRTHGELGTSEATLSSRCRPTMPPIEKQISISGSELRFNAIGLVDGRMLFVTYTMRGDIVRIISARGAEPHEKKKYHEI
jgi:hypothetical protein